MKHILLRPDTNHFGVLCERLCRHPSITILDDNDTHLRLEMDPEMTEPEAQRLADMLVESQVLHAFLEGLNTVDASVVFEMKIQRGQAQQDIAKLDGGDVSSDVMGVEDATKALMDALPVYEDYTAYLSDD